MATLVVAMNQFLDGYVDHRTFRPPRPEVESGLEAAMRALKARTDGEIAVGGPDLARSLSGLGLIDEYRLYLCPRAVRSATDFAAASSVENPQRGAFANPTADRVARSALVAGADRPTTRFAG